MSPFDPLLPLLAAAQRTGPTVWGSVSQIDVTFTTGLKVPLLVAGAIGAVPSQADPGDFDPTRLQARMIQFLAAGPKSATQMKSHTNGRMYDSPGGINELIELGIVEKKFTKLRLTEIGEAIAVEIGDEEQEAE